MLNPVAWFIARKYLFSIKSHSVINIISIISIIAVAIPAAAMIILLSVSNGFSDLIKQLNDTFDPNIKIETAKGGYFDQNSPILTQILNMDNVAGVTQYIEGDCVITIGGKNSVVRLRGVDSLYADNFDIEQAIIGGHFNKFNMLMGAGVAYSLGYTLGISGEVSLYSASQNISSVFGINRHFKSDKISVSGIFMLDTKNDSKYVIAPLKYCQNLLSNKNKISAIAVKVKNLAQLEKTANSIEKIIPEGYVVKDRYQQKELDYAIVKQEKIVIIIMLILVILIASLTLVGSMVMMMIEKREQIYVIGILGGDEKLKKNIFRYQSIIMTFTGGIIGLIVGCSFCLLQQKFGFIKIGGNAMLIDSYPTALNWNDVIIVFIAITVIGYMISIITTSSMVSKKVSKKN